MKVNNKALFSYFGKKDRKIKQIMENLPDMNNVDIIIDIVEVQRDYTLISLYPDKKYIWVDSDKKLIKPCIIYYILYIILLYYYIDIDIIDDAEYNKIVGILKNTEIKTKKNVICFKQ